MRDRRTTLRLMALTVLFVAPAVLSLLVLRLHGWDSTALLEVLLAHRADLQAVVDAHALTTRLAFIALYAVIAALSIPGAALVTVAGGALFGIAEGTAFSVLGATIGAVATFLVARSSLGAALRRQSVEWLPVARAAFARNAVWYLLALRLFAVAPFMVGNVVPACLGARTRTFLWTTAAGITPATAIFAWFGATLNEAALRGVGGEALTPLLPEVGLALAALGVLTLLPVGLKQAQVLRKRAA